MKHLGYDGLSSDETATKYAADGDKLVAILWGDIEPIEPAKAVHHLLQVLDSCKRHKDMDGTSIQRFSAVRATIDNIRNRFEICCQRCGRKNIKPITSDGVYVCGTCASRIARRINRREGRR